MIFLGEIFNDDDLGGGGEFTLHELVLTYQRSRSWVVVGLFADIANPQRDLCNKMLFMDDLQEVSSS